MQESKFNKSSQKSIEKVDDNFKSEKRSCSAYAFISLAAICSAVSNLTLKITGSKDKAHFVLIRCILQYIILHPYLSFTKTEIVRRKISSNILLLTRGISGSIGMFTLALSMNFLSLGDSIAIVYTFPVLVGVFASIFLKEKCGLLNIILTPVVLLGTIFIIQPPFIFGGLTTETNDLTNQVYGVLLGIASSAASAITYVIIRKLGPEIHFSVSVFYFSWVGALFITIYLAAVNQEFLVCFQELPILFGGSLLFFLTQCFLTLAYQRENAGSIALVQTMEVPLVFLLEFLVLGTIPTLFSLIGTGLILSCFILLTLNSIKKFI